MKQRFNFEKVDFGDTRKSCVFVNVEYSYVGKEKRFSVSAETREMWGQCLDELKPYVKDPLFDEIYRLWKLYHLNDTHPECEHQHALGWHELAKKEVNIYHWVLKTEITRLQRSITKEIMDKVKQNQTVVPTSFQSFILNLSYSLDTYTDKIPVELQEYYKPYKSLFAGDKSHVETTTLGWLKETEHPDGLLCKPCPVCGYKYGSGWKYFPILYEDEVKIEAILQGVLPKGSKAKIV